MSAQELEGKTDESDLPVISVPRMPTFSVATLRTVWAEMVIERPERAWRLTKSVSIVALRTVEHSPSGPGWWVESECDPGKFYFVLTVDDHDTCNCMDYRQRGGPCKHVLAVEMLQRCEHRDAEQNDPTIIPFPERAYSDHERFELTPLGMMTTADPNSDSLA